MKTLTRIGLACASAALLAIATAAIPASIGLDSSQTDVNYGFGVTTPPYPQRWQEFVPRYDNIERLELFIHDQHRVDSVLRIWITDIDMKILWSVELADAVLPSYGWLSVDLPRIAVRPGVPHRVNLSVDKYPNDGNISVSVFWLGSTSPTAYFVNDTTSGWPTYSYAFRTFAAGAPPARSRAVEYYHAAFDHYFVTASVTEIQAIDEGVSIGWARTGESFWVYDLGSTDAEVCRFWSGSTFAPKSSHFYTASEQECAAVGTNPDWMFEGKVFAVDHPYLAVACLDGTIPVYRLFNNGQGDAPNHRYTTSYRIRAEMIAKGWTPEGVGAGLLGCVPQE